MNITKLNNDSIITEPDNRNALNVFTEVISMFVRLVLISIGTYINVKIISVCKKEKSKTWQIDIVRAVAIVPLMFFIVIFEAFNDYLPKSISNYTGVSICYIAAFAYVYLPYLIGFSSLVVSVIKYIFIVHRERAIEIGEEKIKRWFSWFNFIHPLVIATSTVLLFDVESFASLIKCFGLQEKLAQRYNSSTGNLERMFLCKLRSAESDIEGSNSLYILTQSFCAIKMVYIWILSGNIPEAFFYYKIFKKMKW